MKTCSYCGLEHSDFAEHCSVDGQPLIELATPTVMPGTQPLPPIVHPLHAPPPLPPPAAASPTWLTARRLRVIEVCLVMTLAFGSSLMASTAHYFTPMAQRQVSSSLAYASSILRDASMIALVWYVLVRRGCGFADLGMKWSWGDFGWSFPLYFGGAFAFYGVYYAIYFSGLNPVSADESRDAIGRYLFGGGVTVAIFLIQFINPFFEELLARAYLMTEIRGLRGSAIIAVAVSTLLQASYHLYQGLPAAISDGATFLVFSLWYAKTKRITPVILAHMYNDVLATTIYFLRHS